MGWDRDCSSVSPRSRKESSAGPEAGWLCTPGRIALRLPHPEGKTAVRVTAGSYDPATETVYFENTAAITLRAEF